MGLRLESFWIGAMIRTHHYLSRSWRISQSLIIGPTLAARGYMVHPLMSRSAGKKEEKDQDEVSPVFCCPHKVGRPRSLIHLELCRVKVPGNGPRFKCKISPLSLLTTATKGASRYDVCNFFGFFDLLPPCPHLDLATSLTMSTFPRSPSDADIISGSSPSFPHISRCAPHLSSLSKIKVLSLRRLP